MICSEFVMCYPPGIPILAPGELITQEIIDYIIYAKRKGLFHAGNAGYRDRIFICAERKIKANGRGKGWNFGFQITRQKK